VNRVQNILWMKYNSTLCDFKSLLFEHGVLLRVFSYYVLHVMTTTIVINIHTSKCVTKFCYFESLLFEHGVFIQNTFMLCFVYHDDNDSCKHSHKNV